jgi:hypothetical protein
LIGQGLYQRAVSSLKRSFTAWSLKRMERLTELMREKNWAIMDVEYIQTSKDHRCVRKLYMLSKDGFTDKELEFHPCVRYRSMKKRNKQSFHYCKSHIHKLPFYPQMYASPCDTAVEKIEQFIDDNHIDFFLYKGGEIESDLCSDIGIPSYNIECIKGLEKAYSHDPRTEVNCYYMQLVELNCF